MEQLETIWADAKNAIRPQMTGLSFRAWIECITPLAIENGILILEIPNADIKKTLDDFYFDSIFSAVRGVNDTIKDVKLILPDDSSLYIHSQPIEPTNNLMLNPKYTFDTFVVGNSNAFAHGAAYAVAQNPANEFNPLFLYGGVGLGKTHLMHAIGHAIKEKDPRARIVYVTCEAFTNELINAIQSDKRMEFRNRYRGVDVLMIDDVQFIAKKQAVQEEFFNTFNTLYGAAKQIIISSDRPPKEISALEERLRSRFESGLTADIQPPDYETRIAILKKRAELEHVTIDDEILSYIAEHFSSNIRELEGSLTRVAAYARLLRRPMNLALAKEALKDILPNDTKPPLNAQTIKETVADYYSVPVSSLLSERRDREIVLPRQIAMYLCHSLMELPFKRISALFERNDHTTAMNACKKVERMISENPSVASAIEDLKKRLV